MTRQRFVYLLADTTETKPSVKPFLIGGALLGGIIGAAMASAYNPCGEPQPGVYCTSTDAATGAVIGAGVGIVVGWLAWVVTTSNKKMISPTTYRKDMRALIPYVW